MNSAILVFAIFMVIMFGTMANPPYLDYSNKFQDSMQQQTLYTILSSIETRLKNLDNIYTTQLSPTLESRLEHYQLKLDAIDARIIRLEALMMFNLDKMSENISTKNFKDDMESTNMNRKIDSIYEGLAHRMSYVDRKLDGSFAKTQGKLDNTISRLEKIENTLGTKYLDLEAEISETIEVIDEIKSGLVGFEENLTNIIKKNANVEDVLVKHVDKISKEVLSKLNNTAVQTFKGFVEKFNSTSNLNENKNILYEITKELKNDLSSDLLKVSNKEKNLLDTQLNSIYKALNSTKVEVQNGVRTILVHLGKVDKENSIVNNEFQEKIDKNFEEIINKQENFFESCHRVQMDESQLESEISTTLEKLIDMLQESFKVEAKERKKLDDVLKNHHTKITKAVTQANNNIILSFDKTMKNDQSMSFELHRICNMLDSLISTVNSSLTIAIRNSLNADFNIILNEIIILKTKMETNLAPKSIETELVQINKILTDMKTNNDTSEIREQIKELYLVLESMNSYFSEYNVDALAQRFGEMLQKYIEENNLTLKNVSSSTTNKTITESENERKEKERLILNIFGGPPKKNTSTNIQFEEINYDLPKNITGKKSCKNILDLIDVRDDAANNDCESTTEVNDNNFTETIDATTIKLNSNNT